MPKLEEDYISQYRKKPREIKKAELQLMLFDVISRHKAFNEFNELEKEIIFYICLNYDENDIAKELNIDTHSLWNEIGSIIFKLKVRNKNELKLYVYEKLLYID